MLNLQIGLSICISVRRNSGMNAYLYNMSKPKKYYIVPAEYLESNEPDLFENGKESACKELGAKFFETGISLEEMRIVPQSGLSAIAEAIKNIN